MRKHNPANERIKRGYFSFLKEANRQSEKTIDQVAAALAAFEASTDYKDFKRFHIEQAKAFKRKLEDATSETGKPLAPATIRSRLMAVKTFFKWVCREPGYRHLDHRDAEYFNLSANDERIAKASREKPVPSLEQIRHVLSSMPHGTDIEKRNRALIAFTILTGARDDAIASLSLRHVDLAGRKVDQDARTVRTKFRKTITTWFFPVGDEVEAMFTDWVKHLQTVLLFGPDDALFPKTRIIVGASGGFEADSLTREHWSSAQPIRTIFRDAFEKAGLPYYNPHSFRNTLVRLGETICRTPEEFKAWSQNLGHESPLTTFTSYGHVPNHRQAEIIAGLRGKANRPEEVTPDAEAVRNALALLQKAMPGMR